MIVIDKNSINRVILTLTENTTISSPFFLFEFISQDNREVKVFTASDISMNTCRYNEFNIEENDTEDLLNGIVNLSVNGYYKYTVYQQDSSTNLDVTLTDKILEKGKVYIKGDIKPVRTTYNDSDDNEYITYE